MALDDFTPAPEAGSSPAKGDRQLDECLFGFPPLEYPEPPPEEEVEVAVVDDLDVGEEAVAAAPKKVKKAEKPQKTWGVDPELDVDLFGFPPLDLSSIEGDEEQEEDTEAGGAQSVQDLLEDDLGDIMREADQAQSSAPAQAPAKAAAPAAPALAAPAPAAAVQPLQAAAAPIQVHTVTAVGPPSKAMWVLTAATIFFMCGLLGIAWRATSSFQEQMQQVRGDVKKSSEELRAATTESLEEISRVERQLLHNQINAQKIGQAPGPVKALGPMATTQEIVLESARISIQGGRFEDARRQLFTLLATADRIPAERREGVERMASFMIASSHLAEAELRTGEKE